MGLPSRPPSPSLRWPTGGRLAHEASGPVRAEALVRHRDAPPGKDWKAVPREVDGLRLMMGFDSLFVVFYRFFTECVYRMCYRMC